MITSLKEQISKLSTDKSDFVVKGYEQEVLDYSFSCSDFFDWVEDEETKNIELYYKNQVAAKSRDEIVKILPELKGSYFLSNYKRPHFVHNLQNIRRAIDEKEKIAVEGGPCLFGQDEVTVEVILSDEASYSFDYSTGRKSDSDEKNILASALEFHNFVMNNAKAIKDIKFFDNKKTVTVDEYESIKILFDIASCLKCPMVMPIVDMSYQKYLEFITREVEPTIREKSIEKFKKIVYRITDLYIDVAKKLGKEYPDVQYAILHERDTELLAKYYERRERFIERKKVIHSLTDVPLRLEPIKDYCTMPALPYYFYDIKNILQVDCLDETDSHRKCKRAHRNELTISALLYPEKIYDNGMTMFNSLLKDKRYI